MIDDHVFLDRDGKTFEIMLNYLRYDRKLWPDFRSEVEQKLLQQELLFWGIRDDTPQELTVRNKFSKQLTDMLQEVPGEKNGELNERGGEKITKQAENTWKKLGPLKLMYLMRYSNVEINQNLQYTQQNMDPDISIYGQSSTQIVVSPRGQSKVSSNQRHPKVLNDYLKIVDSQESLDIQDAHDPTFGNNDSVVGPDDYVEKMSNMPAFTADFQN